MNKNKFKAKKVIIDWKAVTDEINRRLKADYSRNYITNIYSGAQKSDKIKEELDSILKGA